MSACSQVPLSCAGVPTQKLVDTERIKIGDAVPDVKVKETSPMDVISLAGLEGKNIIVSPASQNKIEHISFLFTLYTSVFRSAFRQRSPHLAQANSPHISRNTQTLRLRVLKVFTSLLLMMRLWFRECLLFSFWCRDFVVDFGYIFFRNIWTENKIGRGRVNSHQVEQVSLNFNNHVCE